MQGEKKHKIGLLITHPLHVTTNPSKFYFTLTLAGENKHRAMTVQLNIFIRSHYLQVSEFW